MVLLTHTGKDCDSEGLLYREKLSCKPYKSAPCFSQPVAAAGSGHLEELHISRWTYSPRIALAKTSKTSTTGDMASPTAEGEMERGQA